MTEKEIWFRTGAVAKMLGTSPHRIRELARASVIDSQVRNGYRYIPGSEVERLKKEGLPPMPASTDIDDTPGAEQEAPARPARGRHTQELYGEPSHQLVASKEKVIRLEHAADAQKIKREMRERDRAQKEQQALIRQAEQERRWRDQCKRQATEVLPAEAIPDACAKIDALLDSVPPCSHVSGKVAEIIESVLRPYREREEQARALRAHQHRVARAVQSISLPYAATSAESEEARDLGLTALGTLPVGTHEYQLRRRLEAAILPVVDRINRRRAVESLTLPSGATSGERQQARELAMAGLAGLPEGASDRQLQAAVEQSILRLVDRIKQRNAEAQHRSRIDQRIAFIRFSFVFAATPEERNQLEAVVRSALEQLPPTASSSELEVAERRALAPIEAAIQRRKETEHQKSSARTYLTYALSRYVETRLKTLEEHGDISYESAYDRFRLHEKVMEKIRPVITQDIDAASIELSHTAIEKRVSELVDKHYRDFCK